MKFKHLIAGCSVLLLSLAFGGTLHASANNINANQSNIHDLNRQFINYQPQVHPTQQLSIRTRVTYHRREVGSAHQWHPGYRFTRNLQQIHWHHNGHFLNRIRFSDVAKRNRILYLKTNYGWVNEKAVMEPLVTKKDHNFNYRMRVISDGNLYAEPGNPLPDNDLGTTNELGLTHHWVNVNGVADAGYTKRSDGYYRFSHQGHNYWILGKHLMFDLKSTYHTGKRRLDHIIKTGEAMINHSPYNEKTQHYDCASFLHHIFAKGGINIAYDGTFNQVREGRAVNLKHLRAGDLIFFNTYYSVNAYKHKISGYMSHVGMYLNHHLFLQDSPDDDNGGVDVSSLEDPMWNSYSKDPNVHHLNGFARRII